MAEQGGFEGKVVPAGFVSLAPHVIGQQGSGLERHQAAGGQRRAHLSLGQAVGESGASGDGPKESERGDLLGRAGDSPGIGHRGIVPAAGRGRQNCRPQAALPRTCTLLSRNCRNLPGKRQ
jgi:hypothetical protein